MNDVQILMSAVVALSGAIGVLYKQQRDTLSRIEAKLDECEKDRAQLWDRVAKLEAMAK